MEINLLEEARNEVFREAYELRPGGKYNPETDELPSTTEVLELIEEFGVNDSQAYKMRLQKDLPSTAALLQVIHDEAGMKTLASLARAGSD